MVLDCPAGLNALEVSVYSTQLSKWAVAVLLSWHQQIPPLIDIDVTTWKLIYFLLIIHIY